MNKLLRLSGLMWGVVSTVGCGVSEESVQEPGAPSSLATSTRAVTASQWSLSASMGVSRTMNTVALLDSGLVLVSGGYHISSRGVTTVLSNATLYNPYSDTWQSTGFLNTPRYYAASVRLASGKVLVSGGQGPTWGAAALNTTELYDPNTGTWSVASPMSQPRYRHKTTLLGSGKVLVTGGYHSYSQHATTAELYDPATNTWSPAGDLGHDTYLSVPVRLYSGEVLLVNAGTQQVDLYNPDTNSWRQVASSPASHAPISEYDTFTATRLYSGSVLVVGGGSAELYDPYNDQWSSAPPTDQPFRGHAAALLYSGQLLIAGGDSFQIYNPWSNAWGPVGSVPGTPVLCSSVLLDSGQVLLSGGGNGLWPTSFSPIFTP